MERKTKIIVAVAALAIVAVAVVMAYLLLVSQGIYYCGSAKIASMVPPINSMEPLYCESGNEAQCEEFCSATETDLRGMLPNVAAFYSADYIFNTKEMCDSNESECGNALYIIEFKTREDLQKAFDSMKEQITLEGLEPDSEMVGLNKTYVDSGDGYKAVMWASGNYLVLMDSSGENTVQISEELELGLLARFPSDAQ
jgi:hypothetical protein